MQIHVTLAMSHHLGLTSSFLSSALSGDKLDFFPSMDVYHLLTAGRGETFGDGVLGGGCNKRWDSDGGIVVADSKIWNISL